ncbi:MAG: PilZ domain-containing protein [Leptospiraceae bacterium]|nr:PilZ domain-containing protein [Leptospiraceae bacterium]MDW7975541.1 PilZ domain-containing protein [Leptospiraceae bacterium]
MSNYRDPSKQKRRHARIAVSNLQGTFLVEGSGQEHDCSILDIGTGGMGISSKTLLYPGERIKMRFWLENQEFEIPGIVSRVSGKNVGIIYDNPPQDVIMKIQNFIHSKLFKGK